MLAFRSNQAHFFDPDFLVNPMLFCANTPSLSSFACPSQGESYRGLIIAQSSRIVNCQVPREGETNSGLRLVVVYLARNRPARLAPQEIDVEMFARTPSHPDLYTLRPAAWTDRPGLRDLWTNSEYLHDQLDGSPPDEWIGSPSFVVAACADRLAGLSLAVCDGSPVAWWRALAMRAGTDPTALAGALLDATLSGLRPARARALVCLAFSDWLTAALPAWGFGPLTQVITLRKNDRRVPTFDDNGTIIRPARPADAPALQSVDWAAFDATWRYGPRAWSHLQSRTKHLLVAEREGQVIGYAGGDVSRGNGHVTRLAVHPAHQGQGVGAQLLADIIVSFLAAGAQTVTLNTQVDNAASQHLYRQFNFQPVGYPADVWQRPLAETPA